MVRIRAQGSVAQQQDGVEATALGRPQFSAAPFGFHEFLDDRQTESGATEFSPFVGRPPESVEGPVALFVWGLALSTRALERTSLAPWLLDVHRFLGGLAVLFTVIHFVALSFDPYMSSEYGYTITQAFVPFASEWKPAAMAWGIVAFYLLVAVEVTSLVKNRLPQKFWRGVHMMSYPLYAMATIHLLAAGSDNQNPILRWSVLATVGAVVFFTVYRIIGPGRAESVKQSGPRNASRSRDLTD